MARSWIQIIHSGVQLIPYNRQIMSPVVQHRSAWRFTCSNGWLATSPAEGLTTY
jgi:hypothetical protein